jgi:hypothetical protein
MIPALQLPARSAVLSVAGWGHLRAHSEMVVPTKNLVHVDFVDFSGTWPLALLA